MTKLRLHQLLLEIQGMHSDDRLSEIGDALVSSTIVSTDAFWKAPRVEQLLFALCCILHQAGANGLQALWDYNEGMQAGLLAAAIEGLEVIGEREFHKSANSYWKIVAGDAASRGAVIPPRFSEGTQYDTIDELIEYEPVFVEQKQELDHHGDKFVSCWNTSLPQSILAWLRSCESQLAERICRP